MQRRKVALMDEQAMQRALSRMAHEICENCPDLAQLCLIGIRRRGAPLAQMLAENLCRFEGVPVAVGEIDITFYRDDLSQAYAQPHLNTTVVPFGVTDKQVVLVDDVLYTGRTARAAIDALFSIGRPSRVQLAVLIDRGHRELPIRPDFVGKNVPTSRRERVSVCVPPYDEEMSVSLYEE